MSSTSTTRSVARDPETGQWTLDGVLPTQLSVTEERVLEDLLLELYGPVVADAEYGDEEPPF
ncbi:hypothetical protein [Pseudonocardia sp. NPDC049635]|uniref:hypothetical protein n=1 Tax=Pseudonocardia sp. NPDC049635 TaxID=3155506 RepID=UPI0033C572B2